MSNLTSPLDPFKRPGRIPWGDGQPPDHPAVVIEDDEDWLRVVYALTRKWRWRHLHFTTGPTCQFEGHGARSVSALADGGACDLSPCRALIEITVEKLVGGGHFDGRWNAASLTLKIRSELKTSFYAYRHIACACGGTPSEHAHELSCRLTVQRVDKLRTRPGRPLWLNDALDAATDDRHAHDAVGGLACSLVMLSPPKPVKILFKAASEKAGAFRGDSELYSVLAAVKQHSVRAHLFIANDIQGRLGEQHEVSLEIPGYERRVAELTRNFPDELRHELVVLAGDLIRASVTLTAHCDELLARWRRRLGREETYALATTLRAIRSRG
jgi:hypothetical protein